MARTLHAIIFIVTTVAFSTFDMACAQVEKDKSLSVLRVQEKIRQDLPNRTIWGIAFSADGKLLFAAHHDINESNKKSSLTAWEIPTGKEKYTVPDPQRLKELAIGRPIPFVPEKGSFIGFLSRNERYLVMVEGKGQVRAVKSGDLIREFTVDRFLGASFPRLSQDGNRLATTNNAKKYVRVCDADTGENAVFLKGAHENNKNIVGICFGPAGKEIASVDSDRLLVIWDLEKGAVKHKLTVKNRPVGLALSHDDKWLAAVLVSEVVFYDTKEYKQALVLKIDSTTNQQIAFQPNGPLFATGGGRVVQVWELSTQKPQKKDPAPPNQPAKPKADPPTP